MQEIMLAPVVDASDALAKESSGEVSLLATFKHERLRRQPPQGHPQEGRRRGVPVVVVILPLPGHACHSLEIIIHVSSSDV